MIIQLIILGLFAGFLSGIFGVGGGVVFVPGALLILGCSVQEAVGISLLVIIPTASVAAFSHYKISGSLPIVNSAYILCGSILGAIVGANIAHKLPADSLKKIFAVFLIIISLNMIFGWTDKIKSSF